MRLAHPLRQLAARLVQDESVDGTDQPPLLGQGDEVGRGDDPPLGVAPAHQRLGPPHRPVLQGEERLVQDEKLAFLDGLSQGGVEALVGAGPGVKLGS